jgi:hypothetical protein
MSEAHRGKGIGENNSQYNTCWITKNNTNKKIKISDYADFYLNGWIKGRVLNLNFSQNNNKKNEK